MNYATKCEGYEEKEELLLDNDEKIWRILYGCGDAKLDDTIDFFEERIEDVWLLRQLLKHLGVYNRVIYISEDGYFATNIFDYEYSYFIGKEAAGQIISMYKNIPRKQSPVPVCQHIRNCYRNRKWIYYG